MANYKQLERLERIVHLLSWKNFISKKDLMEELYERYEIQISERSLERDLKILKESFSLDINYNHQHNGFEKWIIPDDSSTLNGIEHINTIVKALNVGLKLKFKREDFFSEEIVERIVTPLRLKEYLNRWYLIAIKDGSDEIRNYGIERMTDLKVLKEPGVNIKAFAKKLSRYNDIVGINYSNEYFPAPVKIVCHTYDNQHKYLATLPLHHSQEITYLENKEEAIVTFFLQPNYEFISQLLRMNENIVVVEPEGLRKVMKAKLESAQERYN
jgi:predicted DNA-binding transcriptional regulator YafY